MRQKLVPIILCTMLAPGVHANDTNLPLPLDKVSFQVSAKEWVTTQTALLGVNINVTLGNANLVRARNEIMERLNKIAKADWHIVQFDRSQDSSGLEKLYVQAQARVNQQALTDIYKNAKEVSKPGAQYEISSVDFKPSLEEKQHVLAKVRAQLYSQITDELNQLNKAYPDQHYSINNLVFLPGDNPSVVTPRAYQAKENMMMMATTGAAAPAVSVSNELTLTAIVEAASNRKP